MRADAGALHCAAAALRLLLFALAVFAAGLGGLRVGTALRSAIGPAMPVRGLQIIARRGR